MATAVTSSGAAPTAAVVAGAASDAAAARFSMRSTGTSKAVLTRAASRIAADNGPSPNVTYTA